MPVATPRPERVERAARALLDAMDRQYGQPVFSINVDVAREDLRLLLPREADPADQSRG